MRTKITLIAASAIFSLSLAACGSGSTETKAAAGGSDTFGATKAEAAAALIPADLRDKEINNAVYNDYAPEMFQKDGQLQGIQVDFANAIGVVLGVKVKNVGVGSFDSIIPGLASGRYDIATSAFGITPERVKQVDFVPHFDIGTGFAVKKGNSLALANRADLCGHSVGVLQGSYFVQQVQAIGDECTAAGKPAVTVDQYPAASAGVLALQNGRVDVYAASQDSLAYQATQTDTLSIQTLVDSMLPQGFGLPKNSGLTKAVVAAMKSLYETGVYQKILNKWGIDSLAYKNDTNVFDINRTTPVS